MDADARIRMTSMPSDFRRWWRKRRHRDLVAALVLLAIFTTPNLILLSIDTDRQQLLRVLASAVLWAAWIAAFASVRHAVAWALPVFVLMPPICLFIFAYQEIPGTSVIGILFDTDARGAREFLEGCAGSVAASLAASLALWFTLLIATRAGTAATVPSYPAAGSHRTAIGRYAARATLLIIAAVIASATEPAFSGIDAIARNGIGNSKDLKALPFGLTKLENVFPVSPLISVADFYIGERNRKQWQAEKSKLTFGAALAPSHTPAGVHKTVYVLMIGESSRSDRWQLSGYGRPTNPRLSDEANVVFLHDVVTPWTFTLASVPVIASRKKGTNRSRFFKEKSIISLFKEAGFKTYWITNQPRPSGIGSEIANISSEVDEAAWLNVAERDYARETSYDIDVAERLASTLAKDEPRQFIVLHIMGSHDAYQARYPTGYNRFRPSMTDAPDRNDHDRANLELIANSYDNTIVYTDHVLDSVIAALKASNAESGLLYTSDHGESLFDGTCDFIGHGGTAKENYMVSALAWLSDSFVAARPEAFAALRRNAAKRLSTENVFDSLAGMAGITYRGGDLSRSIFSPGFEETDRYVNVATTSVDWDQAEFAGACRKPMPRRPGATASR